MTTLARPTNFSHRFSCFSTLRLDLGVAHQALPLLACSPLERAATPTSAVLVARGNCTFEAKALAARRAGFKAMLVVNSDDTRFEMSGNVSASASSPFIAMMVTATDGARLLAAAPFNATLTVYQRPAFDISGVLLFLIALGTLALGALWASEPERLDYLAFVAASDGGNRQRAAPPPPDQPSSSMDEEVVFLDMRAALSFVVFSSIALVILFYFINALIYVLIATFALAGAISVTHIVFHWIRDSYRSWDFDVNARCIGTVNALSCFIFVPVSFVALWWVVARTASYAWILQDLFGVALLLTMQRSVRLPNIKIAAVLLSMAFLYDIYWVFLSGYFFKESVMIKVATGGSTGEAIPMLLKMPRLNDALAGYSLLGLGDIALPGLFVSFVLRFDYMKRTRSVWASYYFISCVAYAMGLVLTYVGLAIMQSGQPALLYLVPCLLGSVFFVAWRRGEIGELWEGPRVPESVRVFNAHAAAAPSSEHESSSSVRANGDDDGLHVPLESLEDAHPETERVDTAAYAEVLRDAADVGLLQPASSSSSSSSSGIHSIRTSDD